MASRAEGNQPGRRVLARLPVMDGALLPCPAALAAVAVAGQDPVALPAEPRPGMRGLAVATAAQAGDGGVGPAAAEQAGLGRFGQRSV